MTTIADLISRAEAEALTAKRADVRAKAAAEAERSNLDLRYAWEDASTARRTADQAVTLLRWEAELDAWVARASRAHLGDGFVDETLAQLSDGDAYLCAALHLKRAGRTVPAGWRSPAGIGA